jgi:hypothetical protein
VGDAGEVAVGSPDVAEEPEASLLCSVVMLSLLRWWWPRPRPA